MGFEFPIQPPDGDAAVSWLLATSHLWPRFGSMTGVEWCWYLMASRNF